MADDIARPVLFLDIDGVLLPFGDGLTYERFPEPCLAALSHLMVPALAATVARICIACCASVLGGRRLCWQRCGVRASAAGSFGCTEAFARRPVQKNQSSCQRTPSLLVHDCLCTTQYSFAPLLQAETDARLVLSSTWRAVDAAQARCMANSPKLASRSRTQNP